jgi:hypothetical protein
MSKLPIPWLLNKGEAEWPVALVPREASVLMNAAGRLAPPFASGLFAECHLLHPTRTDLVVRLHPLDADVILAAAPPPSPLTRVLERWRTPGDRIAFLPAIDLEFDLPGRVVGFFIAPLFEPELMRGLLAIVERDAVRRSVGARPLAEDRGPDVLRAVHDDLSPRVLERVEWCRRMLPSWANFLPGWSCQTRPEWGEAGVRAVATLPRRSMGQYLESVGWPGDLPLLEELATAFLADKPLVSIDMTIGQDGPVKRVGLYWETVAAHPDDASLARLCGRIKRFSWAREDRWNGLMTWLQERQREDGAAGPRSLTLKLIVEEHSAPALKAYVSNFDELGVFPLRTLQENAIS